MSANTNSAATRGVARLEGPANFPLWKLRAMAKLQAEKVWGVVSGDDPEPPSAAGPGATIYHAPTATLPPGTTADTWKIRNQKAHGTLMDTLSDNVALDFADAIHAKELWDAIITRFEKTNIGSRAFYTYVALMQTKWDGSRDIAEHISKICTLNCTLTAMKKPVEDKFLAFLLLFSLPSDDVRWEAYKSAVLNTIPDGKSLSFSEVEVHISAEAARLESASSELALSASHGAAAAPGPSKPQRPKKHCDEHGDCAHSTKECRTLKERKKKKKGRGAKAHQAKEDSDSSLDSNSDGAPAVYTARAHVPSVSKRLTKRIQACTVSKPEIKTHRLIANTGATVHIVPHRHWFEKGSYKTLDPPRRIHFGDGSFVEAVGIGTVRLLSYVGADTHEIALSDVLLAPSFGLSLVSVHRLCRANMRASFSDKTCHLRQHGKKVLVGRYHRKLYQPPLTSTSSTGGWATTITTVSVGW